MWTGKSMRNVLRNEMLPVTEHRVGIPDDPGREDRVAGIAAANRVCADCASDDLGARRGCEYLKKRGLCPAEA